MSMLLQKAREYETRAASAIGAEERPVFHLTPMCGWMNDPNGFSFYKGSYHLFYQYNPYGLHWDTMHWGHAVSRDLLHWEYLPAALAPDSDYDCNGCFSGSAIETSDGKHLLVYTGVRQIKEGDSVKDVQVQCLAFGDGQNYEKLGRNPVIDSSLLPEGASKNDFRDPKIFRLSDGRFCCAVANRAADGSGQILLFTSHDVLSWSYWKPLAENKKRYGTMWECPDFFSLDGKNVLLLSPQDMKGDESFNPGSGTACFIGSFDEKNGSFAEESFQAVDSGIDFYAPQTVLSPDGRRIMIGWLQNWDDLAVRRSSCPWAGMMSCPRELFIKKGRLYQWPVKELDSLRREKVSYSNVKLGDERLELADIHGRVLDMALELVPDSEDSVFSMRLAEDEKHYTEILYRASENTLSLDRSRSGSRRAILHSRECHLLCKEKKLSLRLVMDRYSLEVFVNGGEQVLSLAIFTKESADKISFAAMGGAVLSLDMFTLVSGNQ